MVLDPTLVDDVERLLDDGLTQRAVAHTTGVSRGSVHRIKWGKRKLREREAGDAKLPGPSGPALRCPGCGGKAQRPCVACRTREAPAPRLAVGGDDADALAVDLRGDARKRYDELNGDGRQ